MKKAIQISVLVVSLLVILYIFGGEEGESYSFNQLYVGISALLVSFIDVVSLFGVKNSK